MRYAKIRKLDCANGDGIRTTLFVSGCTHRCPSCFNFEAQDFNYGEVFTKETEDYFIEISKNPIIKGISILGGEPLQQTMDDSLLNLLKRLREDVDKPIWLWTGYTFEEILEDEEKLELIKYVDVLVDGRFEEDKRDLMLKYRGSSNQRVIDVKKTLENNEIVLYDIK